MDTKSRIILLDDLMALNEEVGLPQGEVAGLVDFLAALSDEVREAVLQYTREGDRCDRLARFAKIANLDPEQQSKILKAVGIQAPTRKTLLAEFLGITGTRVSQAKQQLDELAVARQTFQTEFLEPLMKLFGSRKEKEKQR